MASMTTAQNPSVYTADFYITGKRALVTGASRGIGQAIAVGLARHGADVVGVARTEAGLKETAGLADGAPGSFTAHTADLSSTEEISSTVEHAAQTLGGIDILVNNAGAVHELPIEKTDLATYEQVLDLNLRAVWLLIQAASPYLKDGGGKVINIASVLGVIGARNDSAYVAAKHGVVGLTRAMGLEWARKGVTVNAIAPGYVETAMLPDLEADEAAATFIKSQVPMGRWSQPSEFVGPTVFLASEASSYITGQVLVVDGGVGTA